MESNFHSFVALGSGAKVKSEKAKGYRFTFPVSRFMTNDLRRMTNDEMNFE
ncbi:MAG: hypothetical protein JJ895_00455 [Balneolaceae bacterium]|nr:hypothetical protein [Balneolaceae bacterium]